MKIFLSCVSKELGSYRRKLADHLRSRLTAADSRVAGEPIEIRSQEDFEQGDFTLLERLADYIAQCDQVIHLVGDLCGSRPTPEHVRAMFARLGRPLPEPIPELSYTQWEYRLARMLDKPVKCYIARRDARRDCDPATAQSEAEAALQQKYVAELKASGEHRSEFADHLDLLKQVLHDMGLEEHRKINNLPYASLGTLFKGREEFVEQLRQTLGEAEHRGHQQVIAITAPATVATVHGLGGVGKTRAALEYAHRHADEYTALLFVEADSPEKFDANLATLCGAAVLNLAEQDARETEVKVAAVREWLKHHPGWFLILDNVDSPEAAEAIHRFLGSLGRSGQAVVTSRLSNWPAGMEALALDLLKVEDAAEFLLERTARKRKVLAEDAVLAKTLAVELGQLALALEQAAAYINELQYSFEEYRADWKRNNLEVLDWFDQSVMHYPRSVATTWLTSFRQLSGPAQLLLRQLSWLAPDPIPVSLLDAEGALPLGEAPNTRDARPRHALGNLARFSLAAFQQDSVSFTVHRLVQEVTRTRLSEKEKTACLQASLQWVNGAFTGNPQDVRTWTTLDPLATHVGTVAAFADDMGIAEPTAILLYELGQLYYVQARFTEAEPLMRRSLQIDEKSYGLEFPRVARDLNNLTVLLQKTNRLVEAEALMRRALEIDVKSYGVEHPYVAIDINNLAQLLQHTNRLAEAEPLMRCALEIDKESYGAEHPNVARDLGNLAHLLKTTNRLAEAEPLMRRALEIDVKSYGADHPNVARGLNNLAQLLQHSDRLAEAEPMLRRALEIDEKSYGTEHPEVAMGLNNLALLLQDTNRPAEAEPLMRRALAIEEKSYGAEHPRVADCLNNLATLLFETNRLAEAEPLVRRALAIDEKSYGADHPNVARGLNNLAQLLQATNQLAEAESLMRRALEIDEKSYGADHPSVAKDLNNLAALDWTTNRMAEAEPLMRRALEIDEKSYGADHPSVARDLNNLAALLQDTNRLAEAEPLMRRALEIDEKSYGAEHPNVARDLGNLAHLLKTTNRLAEAEPLMRRALEIDEKSYGAEHPDVARDLNNLAALLQATKRLAEADPLMRRQLEIFLRFSRATGHPHPRLPTAINNYGGVLQELGHSEEQIMAALRALAPEFFPQEPG